MRIRKNGTVVNLTESDLQRIVKRTLNEQTSDLPSCKRVMVDLAKEDMEKKQNKGKRNKGSKPVIGTVGTAEQKVTLKTTVGPIGESGVVVAYKGRTPWCKCG
jgi:dihydrodipicolinate reductase